MFNQVINTESVRAETLDGTDYAVAPITLLKPMNLNVPANWGVNEAYLPAEQAKESIPSWNGTPLTLNHPSASNGAGTTANSPEIHEKSVLGRVFNAEWSNGAVDAEAWFNKDKIRDMGGTAEQALENVLNGKGVEVSTGYRASKLPSGEYDGETRNAVQGNLKPDHVAVLPNSKGKCSIEAGCGVGQPVANSLIVTNAEHTYSEGDIVEWESSGGMAMGVVRDTISEGQYDSEIDGDQTITAPAALIEIVDETDEGLEPTGTMVGHKTDTDTLSMVQDPPEVVENQEVPDEYRFGNPGEAMSKAQEMGLSAIHTHGDGEDTVFMPGESHEALVDELDMSENQLSEARTPTFDGTETTSWADVSKDLEAWVDALGVDAESVSDMSQEQKQTVADHTLLGDPDADTWQELSYFPVVNPSNQNLNRGALMAVLSGRGAQADIPSDTLESARSVAQTLLEDEFDEDMSENSTLKSVYNALKSVFEQSSDESAESDAGSAEPTDPTPRDNTMNELENETMIQELADNTDFDRENLEAWDGTDCLANLYENHMSDDPTENDDGQIVFDSQEEFEAAVEDVVSNRQEQSEKERLASEIAANSTEYEDSEGVLEDFPTKAALNTKKKDVIGAEPDFSAGVGASAQPATNTEDADDLKMFAGDE